MTASFVHGDLFHVAVRATADPSPIGPGSQRTPRNGNAISISFHPNRPIIGASGAIAVMLGAYLALFPRARMRMIVFWLPFWKRFSVPAWVFLVYWIGLQLLSFAVGDGQLDGVAYAVHVGGFAVGVLGAVVWKTMVPSAEEKLLEFTESSFVAPSVRRGWRRLLGS